MKRREFLLVIGTLSIIVGSLPALAVSSPCPPPGLVLDADSTVSTPCSTSSSSLPYISSMSAYQVRQLTGTLAPTNGKATVQSATPAEWLNSDPGTNDGNVIDFWSGGIGDSSTNRLYIAGGGHTNSANNGIYSYDFSGTSAPTGFTLQAGSQSSIANTPPANAQTYTTYSDGKASSRHTYDGINYVDGKIYVMGGSHHNSGYFNPTDTWRFQNGTWTKLADAPHQNFERPTSALDPTTKKILLWSPSYTSYAFFNTVTETWGSVKSMNTSYSAADVVLCYDPSRGRIVLIGGGLNGVWTVNWSSETITSISTHPVSGILNTEGVTPLYDAARDVFWILGGRGSSGSSGYSTLYEMNASTFAITAHPLSGDSISVSSNNWGSFKRAVLLNGAIGFVSGFTAPAYVIKLP